MFSALPSNRLGAPHPQMVASARFHQSPPLVSHKGDQIKSMRSECQPSGEVFSVSRAETERMECNHPMMIINNDNA